MDQRDIEFVLVDFDTPGVREHVEKHFREELSSGYLRYFHCAQLPYWHAPLAKNTSHRVATGDILVNLDCDNFTGPRGGRFVMNLFEQFGMDTLFHQKNPDTDEANWGRIAMSRASFHKLGGYAEDLMPAGGQDWDLLAKFRARWPKRTRVYFASRKQQRKQQQQQENESKQPMSSTDIVVVHRHGPAVHIKYPASATGAPRFVEHSDELKMKHLDPRYAAIQKTKGWNATELWEWMNTKNMRQSDRDIEQKIYRNNRAPGHVIGLAVTEGLGPRSSAERKSPAQQHEKSDEKKQAPVPVQQQQPKKKQQKKKAQPDKHKLAAAAAAAKPREEEKAKKTPTKKQPQPRANKK
jgi:hypothetical protein